MRACTFNDPKKMHEQLVGVYEASGKREVLRPRSVSGRV
jgi:hypothetical protein